MEHVAGRAGEVATPRVVARSTAPPGWRPRGGRAAAHLGARDTVGAARRAGRGTLLSLGRAVRRSTRRSRTSTTRRSTGRCGGTCLRAADLRAALSAAAAPRAPARGNRRGHPRPLHRPHAAGAARPAGPGDPQRRERAQRAGRRRRSRDRPDRLRRSLPRPARLRPRRRVRVRDDDARGARARGLPVVAGYHEVAPLDPRELALLPDLIRTRLAMSVAMAARQHTEQPDNDYLLISQVGIAALLDRLGAVAARARAPAPARRLRLRGRPDRPRGAPPPRRHRHRTDLRRAARDAPVIDFSGGDPPPLPRIPCSAATWRTAASTTRPPSRPSCPASGARCTSASTSSSPAGEPILAPLDGTVRDVPVPPAARDWGGIVVLDHETPDGIRFHTLYGHLDRESPNSSHPATRRAAATSSAPRRRVRERRLGAAPAPAAAHDRPRPGRGLHGVGTLAERDVWESASPDPNLILGVPGGVRPSLRARPPTAGRPPHVALERAQHRLRRPLKIVRGAGVPVRRVRPAYLDLVNNVCHVGHAHPRVVRRRGGADGTPEHQHALPARPDRDLRRRLTATLPDPLGRRLPRQLGQRGERPRAAAGPRAHRRRDVLVLEHAYHGNLTSLIAISPYKFAGPGGGGCVAARSARSTSKRADPRAPGRRGREPQADGRAWPRSSPSRCRASPARSSCRPATCGAYEHVRAAGAVCIADEVQVGFGRVGSAFWGFELRASCRTSSRWASRSATATPSARSSPTPEIARSFETGMEYFNTFGGNPVSCAVGLAVLDVIADERLQAHAARLGARIKAGLRARWTASRRSRRVRGEGLFLGVELSDAARRRPRRSSARGAKACCSRPTARAATCSRSSRR